MRFDVIIASNWFWIHNISDLECQYLVADSPKLYYNTSKNQVEMVVCVELYPINSILNNWRYQVNYTIRKQNDKRKKETHDRSGIEAKGT